VTLRTFQFRVCLYTVLSAQKGYSEMSFWIVDAKFSGRKKRPSNVSSGTEEPMTESEPE
jgi:hypothetical protein